MKKKTSMPGEQCACGRLTGDRAEPCWCWLDRTEELDSAPDEEVISMQFVDADALRQARRNVPAGEFHSL